MSGKPKKNPREKDLTSRYLSGGLDEDRVEQSQRFSARNKGAERDKITKTALLRAGEQSGADIDQLPAGQVVQVHSLFSHVQYDGVIYLCVVRRTLTRVSDAYIVVGDRVRFRDTSTRDDNGAVVGNLEGVIEQVLPRETILTRADSFKGNTQHPIVANASQMLIVASLRLPRVKWGLVDRMIVAARSGKLQPIVCLNKMDLAAAPADESGKVAGPLDGFGGLTAGQLGTGQAPVAKDAVEAREVLAYYRTQDVRTLETSVELSIGLGELRDVLRDRETVLAGHSGVGKSSLIRSIQPHLDLRVGEVSHYTDKGRHTTTSARRYPLDFGGSVIDTPGVKLFGLWGVTRDNLEEFFPDIVAGTAPEWRRQSYERMAESLGKELD
jgi:ribosome biogenesis GTPase